MNSSYLFHSKNDSASLYEKVFVETAQFRDLLGAILSIFSEVILLLCISIGLFYLSPYVTIFSFFFIGVVLIMYYLFLKGKSTIGVKRLSVDNKLTEKYNWII